MSNSWALSQVWNDSLNTDRPREMVARDYIYASELGGSYYDRYWKMKGRKPTTPPNLRAQRKFEAGNLTEWVVLQILKRARVLYDTQGTVNSEDTQLSVHGRYDYLAGGMPQQVELDDLPDVLADISLTTIEGLIKKYPKGLADQGLELKSCSSFMFDKYEKTPNTMHALQSFHYAYNTGKPWHLVYLCKDDLRMAEYVILPKSKRWEELYLSDIRMMAEVIQLNEEEIKALKEPLLAYDGETHKFSKNWKIEYSNYLTDYGFERPDLYSDIASKLARRINGVVKHILNGKELSKVNLKTLKEVYEFYPEAEVIINALMDENPIKE